MQPTFLPWVGYFKLMHLVDVFVFLDDVQLQRRSWQVRNRVLLNGSETLITVPLQRAPRDTHICQVKTAIDSKWINRTVKTLEQAYSAAPFGNDIVDILGDTFASKHESVAGLNIQIIQKLTSLFGIEKKIYRSKELSPHGQRSSRLLNICNLLNCDKYLSPIGSKQYLDEDDVFSGSDVKLEFFNYTPSPYPQSKTKAFVPYLSAVDLLANLGPEQSREFVRNTVHCT